MLADKIRKIHNTDKFLSKVNSNQYEFKSIAEKYLKFVTVEEFMCIESVFESE